MGSQPTSFACKDEPIDKRGYWQDAGEADAHELDIKKPETQTSRCQCLLPEESYAASLCSGLADDAE